MNYKEVKKHVGTYLKDFFKANGFNKIDVNTFGIEVIKKDNEIEYRFGFTKLIRPNGIELQTNGRSVKFILLEDFLMDITSKYQLDHGRDTLRGYDNSEKAVKRRNLIGHILISTEEDFKTYAEAVKSYCQEVLFPFFDKYSNLKAVNELINTTPEEELSYHIGNPFMFKKMIIMKWCKNPDFEKYSLYLKERFEAAKDLENGRYLPYLYTYYELAEKLDMDVIPKDILQED